MPKNLTSSKGFYDLEKLYYCAQKNFIELYILEIEDDEVNKSLSAQAVSLLA